MRDLKRAPFLLFHLLLIACYNNMHKQGDMGILVINIQQEKMIYEESDYGEPPQFAIWLENRETKEVRSLAVTYRTATGDFEGKSECPVSLPAWIELFRKETGRDDFPTTNKPAPDAITLATPKKRSFSIQTQLPQGSKWYYYIEMNVAADYNRHFSLIDDNYRVDYQGNGQPSIIYRGEITVKPGQKSSPVIIGRTEQFYFSSEIIPDIEGITSAEKVFSKIEATIAR